MSNKNKTKKSNKLTDILQRALAHGAGEALGVDGTAADLDKDTAEKKFRDFLVTISQLSTGGPRWFDSRFC